MFSRHFNFILFFIAMLPCSVSSVEIVRMDIQIGAAQYDLDLELYDSITPNTVTNFLNYVDDEAGNHRYEKSFIHRSVTDFILQGGGYTFDPSLGSFDYDPATDTYSGGLQKISVDAPIINEFIGSGLSNVRGTIAMARTSDPDSATSQWFINQVDNTFLDGGDGYAVFGRVLDDGMSVVDQIGAVPIYDPFSIPSAFEELPLVNYVNGDPVIQDNLVRINSVTAIKRPIFKSDTDPIDFAFVPIDTTAQKTIILSNAGNADLIMDGTSLAALVAPFNIAAETCSNNTLSPESVNPSDTCSVTIEFSPVITGNYQGNLVIAPSVNPYAISSSLGITGEGVPTAPVLSVQDNITLLDFSSVATNTVSTKTITIQNRGGEPLDLSSVVVSGLDAGQFSIDTGCSNSTSLSTGLTCTLAVNFEPVSEGQKIALLSINSNAGLYEIDLNGSAAGPEIELSKLSLDFGFVQTNESVSDGFTVSNLGLADLEVTSLTITGTDAADFTQANTCPSVNTLVAQSLAQDGLCAIIVTFTPTSSGVKIATLTITTNDSDESVIDISLAGATGEADIDGVQQVDVGIAQISLTPVYEEIMVTNIGVALLDFSAVNITGVDASSYLVGHNCPGTPTTSGSLTPLAQDEACTIEVRFLPVTGGVHNAQLEIASNDPDEPVFTIALTGLGELDIDGIADSEEQNSPNNGDANNDNEQDDIQNNVASFLTNMGVYATIVSAPDTLLYEVSVAPNPSPDNMPATADFKHGIFQYTVVDSSPVVTVGVFMPANDTSNTYYKYGPTPDNLTPHWYDFSFDGMTGAEYVGQVAVENPDDGSIVNRSMFLLSYIDGQRGDDDLTVNSEIVNVGALSSVAVSSDGTGSISWYLIVLSTMLLVLLRLCRPTIEIKSLRI